MMTVDYLQLGYFCCPSLALHVTFAGSQSRLGILSRFRRACLFFREKKQHKTVYYGLLEDRLLCFFLSLAWPAIAFSDGITWSETRNV